MRTNYSKSKKVQANEGMIDRANVDRVAAVGSFVYVEGGGLLTSS